MKVVWIIGVPEVPDRVSAGAVVVVDVLDVVLTLGPFHYLIQIIV